MESLHCYSDSTFFEQADYLDDAVANISASYAKHINPETRYQEFLPDKDEIIVIITLLRKLLLPGYFNEKSNAGAAGPVREILTEAAPKLQRQICRALNLDAGQATECSARYGEAGVICQEFLTRLPALTEILRTDVEAAYDGDPAASSQHEIIFAYPGIYAISIYRLAHELYLLSVPLIPRIMTEHAHSTTGIDIHPGATIGRYFFIDHGTGVVIGETTKIGARVKLYQGVTLGGLSTREGQNLRGQQRHPTLEDEVTVYSGATILGGATVIGKGSVIGGNVFITQSTPPNTRVNVTVHTAGATPIT